MELSAEQLTLIERFREHAADKRRAKLEEEALQLERDERKHKEENIKREEKEEREREEIVLASTAQIAAFDRELDDYDTATVHALMINQEQLDAIRLRLERSEAAAFHLDDGRSVFRTRDGLRVFDKAGTELSRDIVRPEDIPASAPDWETRKADQDTESNLLRQRNDIHAFQHRVDQAREQSEKKGLTADALSKMEADLKANAPQAVRDAQEHPGGMPDDASMENREAQRSFQPFDKPSPTSMARPSPM